MELVGFEVTLLRVQGLTLDESEGVVEKPRPLSWYPDRMAWHFNFTKRLLRKNPLLKDFHGFLKREEVRGAISRQEAVSMIPPMFLGVEPQHKVLHTSCSPHSNRANTALGAGHVRGSGDEDLATPRQPHHRKATQP